MPDQPGTLEVIARELAVALGPLEERLASGNAEAFLRQLGIVVPGAFDQAAAAVENTPVKAAAPAPLVVNLVTPIEAEDARAIVAASLPLIGAIRDLLSAVSALEPALKAALAAAAALTPAQKTYLEAEMTALPGRLVEWMLIEYVETRARGLADALAMFRII